MKKVLKNSFIFLAMQVLVMGSVMASSRVDLLLEEDSLNSLDAIELKLDEMDELQSQLKNIDLHLAKRKSGEGLYLKFERIGAGMFAAGIVSGISTIYFPPGLRAMIGANVAARGMKSGMIVLSVNDVNKMMSSLIIMQMKIKSSKRSLFRESEYYCKQVSNHQLCD